MPSLQEGQHYRSYRFWHKDRHATMTGEKSDIMWAQMGRANRQEIMARPNEEARYGR